MKIKSVTLNSFRSHAATTLELDRFTFIVGANASGKTSIASAIEWCLTGVCEVTDEGGRHAEDLIHKGAKSCEVELTVDGTDIIRTRSITGSSFEVRQGKNTFSGKVASDWLLKHFPSLPVLQAVLNSGRFVELDATAQKRLLSSVLADNGVPIDAELKGAVASFWSDGEVPERLTIAQLDKFHKAAYERRTQLNRDLKTIGDPTAPEMLEAPNADDINAKLLALRSERDGVIREKNNLVRDHEAAVSRRQTLEADIAALEVLILPIGKEKELKAIADKADKLKVSVTLAATLRAKIEARKAELNSLTKLGNKAGCPTCYRDLTPKDLESIASTLSGHVEHLVEQLRRADADEAAYGEALKAHERINTSIKACGEKEQFLADLALLPELGEAPATGYLDEKIATLDGRIAKGQDVLVKSAGLREQIKQYNDSVAKRARIDDELAIIEKVLAFAGPDGARKLAAGKLPQFKDAMNAVLQKFGYLMGMELEPYSFSVGSAEGKEHPRSLNQLSESEKFRFSVSFQIALATVTEIGLVLVDRADVLDKESRRQMTAMLLSSNLDQAIVCSTSTEPLPDRVPDGVRFYQLEQDGGVTRVAAESPAKAVAA